MKKIYLLRLFAVLTALQLAVPVVMIREREEALKHGLAFKFKTAPVDPYDAFRGRYVAIRVDVGQVARPKWPVLKGGERVFALLTYGADGFAQIAAILPSRPSGGAYLPAKVRYVAGENLMLDFPIDRYYMTEKAAPEAEKLYRERSRNGKTDTWVLVKIKDGLTVVEGLYINGKRIEDLLKR